jgi:hypothetical protein
MELRSLRTHSVVILAALGALWLASGTQREHAVLSEVKSDRVRGLEVAYAESHNDPEKLRELAQSYIDAATPGLALSAIEAAPKDVREMPRVEHVYARALIDQGRAKDALASERRVLDKCAASDDACDAWLLASATRRADILQELVQLGVDDAQAHPEVSSIAYNNATRQASFAVR